LRTEGDGVKARHQRQARNEALIREVNERIDEIDRRAGAATDEHFVCECGREDGCGETVSLTLTEYDEVRKQDDRFAVYPGHETGALERVVKQTERYVLVDKAPAAEGLVADDPRGAPSQ
jgi:hypothetical protein